MKIMEKAEMFPQSGCRIINMTNILEKNWGRR
jgi:hypothetical protein